MILNIIKNGIKFKKPQPLKKLLEDRAADIDLTRTDLNLEIAINEHVFLTGQLAHSFLKKEKIKTRRASLTGEATTLIIHRQQEPALQTISFKFNGNKHLFLNESGGTSECPRGGVLVIQSYNGKTNGKYYIVLPYSIFSKEGFSALKLQFFRKIMDGVWVTEKLNDIKFLVVKEDGGPARLYIDNSNGLQSSLDNTPVRVATCFSKNPHEGTGKVKLAHIPRADEAMLAGL